MPNATLMVQESLGIASKLLSTWFLFGLYPVLSRYALDALALLGLMTILTASSMPVKLWGWWVSVGLTAFTAGLTHRWPLSLPMIPFCLLQLVGRRHGDSSSRKKSKMASQLCIWLAAVLCLAMLAVELPPPTGPFAVGVADVYLPMPRATGNNTSFLPVRIFYPATTTANTTTTIPYIDPLHFDELCRQTAQRRAPGPLAKLGGWILHNWKWTRLPALREADLLLPPLQENPEGWPVMVYSHGLGGTAEMYAYQSMAAASRGIVVLLPTHLDGSATVVRLLEGQLQVYDTRAEDLRIKEGEEAFTRARRDMTAIRVAEFLAVVQAFDRLLDNDDSDNDDENMHSTEKLMNMDFLKVIRSKWKGHVRSKQVIFAGHSFGGATALAAAYDRPDLVLAVVAHDPATDWMTDDARRSVFLQGTTATATTVASSWQRRVKEDATIAEYSGGPAGYASSSVFTDDARHSIYDTPLLILGSQNWRDRPEAPKSFAEGGELLEAYGIWAAAAARTTKQEALFVYHLVRDAFHIEFTDGCMLTPVWLARLTGMTGPRNPLETALEIHERTWDFLEPHLREAPSPSPARESENQAR